MSTFKNNSKYAELLFTYLELAVREVLPVKVTDVLREFAWTFKGGSLATAAESTRLQPVTSSDVYPHGPSATIADEWPEGINAQALRRVLVNRIKDGRTRSRGLYARWSTYRVVTHSPSKYQGPLQVYTGMKAIYHVFGQMWEWSPGQRLGRDMRSLEGYMRELIVGVSGVSHQDLPTVDEVRSRAWACMEQSRLPGMWCVLSDVKALLKAMTGSAMRNLARKGGQLLKEALETGANMDSVQSPYTVMPLGSILCRVTQGVVCIGLGPRRFALSVNDMERLHQLVMSTCSALVGVCAQSVVGTMAQRVKSSLAIRVAEQNVTRIVESSRRVAVGEEVLVCKGYRRAYTAYLGRLSGPLCRKETLDLVKEAESTAEPGVLDVTGFLSDLSQLDAASGLNAGKMFKICPAPDVSPGGSMIDRIKQVGNSNVTDPIMMPLLDAELKAQILRAHMLGGKTRWKPRPLVPAPTWLMHYQRGEYDMVPSAEIDACMEWEGSAEMPHVAKFDPANWKDSGLGADTIRESEGPSNLGHKSNMLSRLVFDETCPMPGTNRLNEEGVIKFFVKAEGHKDPARGIFSANLQNRQIQSWLERGVDSVAKHHPSYMIGQTIEGRNAKVHQLTSRPESAAMVPLFYSFDISGWSAKMPGEVQRMSHEIWGKLYNEPMYRSAHLLNEGAHIYLNLEGYKGWFKNTEANLEGFNGKEMTMVLVALLSLAVKQWRAAVVSKGIMAKPLADVTSALLFAYIDDGLSRIDLPKAVALTAFELYKETVIDTFSRCGFSIEVTKCFPSDRFAIFLNEVYLAGRHVVHGVRAAMAISSEPTERHTSLIERVSSVTTGCRGAVMAGLGALPGCVLMAYHTYMHMIEWVGRRDPVLMAIWAITPRSWGGLGLPNMMQLYTSGSGAALDESIATLQAFAKSSIPAKRVFSNMTRCPLETRTATEVLSAPLSGSHPWGIVRDNRVAIAVRKSLKDLMEDCKLSSYASRLLAYADNKEFEGYAGSIVPLGHEEVLQEQMLVNVSEAHPHSVFSSFARRLEKTSTIMSIVGREKIQRMVRENRDDASDSIERVMRMTRTMF